MQDKFNDTKTSIFIPIHLDIINQIKKDVLGLHTTFWLNRNTQK